jgi:hypothetical protein
MTSAPYPNALAISRLSDGERSRELQNIRAIKWLLAQAGGPLMMVTPRRDSSSESVKQLVARPDVNHLTWRGFNAGSLDGARVLYAWPDREHLGALWGSGADAIAVIEWNEGETAEWIRKARPVQLHHDHIVQSAQAVGGLSTPEHLPNGIGSILEYVAGMAAGYSSGSKRNEEDKLKADMTNRPERWVGVTVEQVRAKCVDLGMRPSDVDTIADFVQRRRGGRRFNVRTSYRDFRFD